MSFTFGAAISDRISWTGYQVPGSSGSEIFVCGWWYPTTLTATRVLWAAGSIFGAEINATTSEIRLRTDNTTDGQWTTSGVGLTVNQWNFLAFANVCNNTGPAAAWRVWSGTIDTAPIEVTVTQAVAPVGNFVGSTTRYIGNNAGNALAFQGDIGNIFFMADGSGAGVSNPMFIGTSGQITNIQAQLMYERFVLPGWSGTLKPLFLSPSPSGTGPAWERAFIQMDGGANADPIVLRDVNSAVNPFVATSRTGATASQLTTPRAFDPVPLHPNRVRR